MKCIAPKSIWVEPNYKTVNRSLEWCERRARLVSVPCNKCLACLSNKRADWCFRLEQEYKYSRGALFVTLTYNDWHMRHNRSLCKRDVQLFLKRLRKRDGTNKIRYYAVGEYGTKTARPHYHVLLFNCRSEEMVRAAWCDQKGRPIGNVHFGKVTSASVAYVCKYIVQPQIEVEGMEKPFAIMSRGYGIGGRYLTDEMVKWHRDNEANYTLRDAVTVRLPRFYRGKIWYSPEDRERISKASTKMALDEQAREERFLKKRYGDKWMIQLKMLRDAQLSRIRVKVAYSQTF